MEDDEEDDTPPPCVWCGREAQGIYFTRDGAFDLMCVNCGGERAANEGTPNE